MTNETQEKKKFCMQRKATCIGFVVIAFALLAAFGGGAYIGSHGTTRVDASTIGSVFSPSTQPVPDVDLSEFWRVWRLMDEKFVYASSSDELSSEERVRGAIQGLVKSFGDDYSVYLPPVDSAFFHEEMSGEFGGVGMEVGLRDDVITVIAPIEDTPAFEAGMMAGDKILKVNGTSTEDMSVDTAVKLIRGEKGTDVTITIYREGDMSTRDITITRGTIAIPTIKTEDYGDHFRIKLYTFNQIAEREFAKGLQEYAESGADNLIIDLRGNPGGYMQSAINIASFFLPNGEVVLRERIGNEGEEVVHRSSGISLGEYKPDEIVVLIDKGSASASEILAGALRDGGVATLIGETSFGKGTVQELVDLPSESSLKVTIARWYTPAGLNITNEGLTPDIEVLRSFEHIEAGEDPQLEAALEHLD